MPIKTLHITNSYHPSSGGIRTFYDALLKAANRQNRHMRLVVPGEKTCVQEVGEFGRIYHIAAPKVPIFDSRYRWLLPHNYAFPGKTELRRILAEEKPDLVEVCDKFWLIYLSGVLRRRWIPGLPAPVIVGLSCERLDDNVAAYLNRSRGLQDLSEFFMRNCYAPRFDFHIAASDYIAAEVRRVLPDRLRGRLYVCPMGVDCESLNMPSADYTMRKILLRQLGGNSETILLLYAGRLSKEKNLQIFPEMLEKLAQHPTRDYRLVIAGDGVDANSLRSALEQRAPGCSLLLGHCTREKLRDLFRAVDIFVHPNPREPFGIAPLEAMASGLPLVAPESGGLLTYANRKNAWLTENTATAFARAVESIHDDFASSCAKIERARLTAEEFSWTRVTENYFDLYDRLHRRHFQELASKNRIATLPLSGADVPSAGILR